MNKWTGVLAVALSTLVLAACGAAEDARAPEDALGQVEAGIDICGNGICYSTELSTCPEDCNYGGYCGDGRCSGTENYDRCSRDCPRSGCFMPENPEPREPVPSIDICGNGICYSTELNTCPADCNYGGYCGDGRCSGTENYDRCSRDCPRC